jgi:molybdopterin-containing oxidoreductase family iron-sulfur binding subunit
MPQVASQQPQVAEKGLDAPSLSDLRRRLAESEGPLYWRSLEELAGTATFREAVASEFPSFAEKWSDTGQDPVSRRKLLKVMAASLALLGLNGCFHKKPQGTLVPYPKAPEETIPGRPVFFATAMPLDGYGMGVLALSAEGRPVKLEGNPDHPASQGAANIFMQASLLDLYDPDRSRNIRIAGEIAQWSEFNAALTDRLAAKRSDGNGLRLLTGTVTSPTLAAQIQEFLKRFPGSQWHRHDPILAQGDQPGVFEGPVNTIYDLRRARVIVSFAGDFMHRGPGSVRYARDFADGRRVREASKQMNRLYVVESTLTITGSMADNRLPLRPSQIEPLVRSLAQRLGALPASAPPPPMIPPEQQRWVDAVAADLESVPATGAADDRTLVLAGDSQTPAVAAVVHSINEKLGNIGRSVLHTDPVEAQGAKPLEQLVTDMRAGTVDMLLMLGTNPAYSAAADIPFATALKVMSSRTTENGTGGHANFTAHLSTHFDETSYLAQWHVPRAHWLESWGDTRAFDGTASIVQPLIAPLYGARSDWEFMEAVLGRADRLGSEIVRGYWQQHFGSGDFEQWWVTTLQKGVVEASALPHRQAPALRAGLLTASPASAPAAVEVLFEPDPNMRGGEFANNAWLQELPKPFTKLTWDNAAVIGIGMAEKLAGANNTGRHAGMLVDGQVVRITYQGRQIEAPVVLLPGQPDDMVTLHLGYGRTRGGEVLLEDGKPRGYNAYALRTSDAPWAGAGAQMIATEEVRFLAVTRNHHAMSALPGVPGIAPWLKPQTIAEPGDSDTDLELRNRNLVRTATLDQYRQDSRVFEKLDPRSKKPILSLYPGWDYQHGLQWGMAIDMTSCIGCNACVIACQAENNIPVVGKQEVGRQREMHWIRIDDYFGGSLESPRVYHQPVPCMHCENAPCEYVCPVGATTHSDEGLNEMTYNRCVGTRYCSNNCPYKVRRFNFLLYSDYQAPTLKLLHNPDVTVRSRGVMEKCTYCVQRIDRTRIEMEERVLALKEQARRAGELGDEQANQRLMAEAEKRGREVVRTLKTACQQTCPTQAIVFGDIRDPESEVAKAKNEPANYGLLTELTTVPRTTYLAHVTNPNPALRPARQQPEGTNA